MAKCAVEDCPTDVAPHLLMCLPHWRTVPQAIQRKVNATWKRVKFEPEAYREARAEAIAAATKSPQDLLL